MIRLIKFAGGNVARFPLTPTIISQIPGLDDMVVQYGDKKFEELPVYWPSAEDPVEEAQAEAVENWNQLVNNYISNNWDLQDTKILIIARFSPIVLESRQLYLERYYRSPDVLGAFVKRLKIYCPMSVAGRKHKEEFDRWIVV